MGRSREEWFRMADVSEELAQRNGNGEGVQGSAPSNTPFGVLRRGNQPTMGFSEADLPFGKAGEGKAQLPSGIEHYPAQVMREIDSPPPRDYMVEGLVPCGAATSLYGDGGVAKSMLALSLCVSVAAQRPTWLDRELMGGSALYIDFELTVDEQMRRTRDLCRGSGYAEVPDNLYYLGAMGRDPRSVWWSAFHACDWYSIGLVVIDSLGIAMHGEAENAADVIAFYKAYLAPLLAEGIAVLLVDHQAKGGDSYQSRTSFGSVYKRNLVRSEVQVEAVDQDEMEGTLDVVFRHRKHNFGPLTKPFGAELRFREGEVQVNARTLSNERLQREQSLPVPDRVLMAMESLGEPTTSKDVADLIDAPYSTVKMAISRLRHRGKIKYTGERVRGVELIALAKQPTFTPEVAEWEEADDGSSEHDAIF